MNKFRIARAGIDVNAGLKRVCGDTQMYEHLLEEFLEDTHYQDFLTDLKNKDVKRAFADAHALKGLVGTLSMTKLYEAVCPAVEVLRVDSLDVDEYLPMIEEAYGKVVDAITDMKNSKNA